MSRISVLIACLVALASQSIASQAADKVAVIVGINDYPNHGPPLTKAVNDADAMASVLTEHGYKVLLVRENATRARIRKHWIEALKLVDDKGTLIFYFAGHGIEVKGRNYLLPNDAPKDIALTDSIELRETLLEVDGLMDDFREKQKDKNLVGIFIFDACRNDPTGKGKTRGALSESGLAPVRPTSEMFVMYSAAANQRALDALSDTDTNKNSVYTRHLIPLLKNSDRSLSDIAQDVRGTVYETARAGKHDQWPAYYDELIRRRTIKGDNPPVLDALKAVAALPEPARNDAPRASMRSIKEPVLLQMDCDPRACPEMVAIPPGSVKDRAGREIKLATPIAIARYEVTNLQWNYCVKGSKDSPSKCRDARGYVGGRTAEHDPVTNVSFAEARDYVEWLSKLTGKKYRLPTESEWEYAARAGSSDDYYFEADIKSEGKAGASVKTEICNYANGADASLKSPWLANTACTDGYGRTVAPVGRFKPNAFGLHDMYGNAWEWVDGCGPGSPAGADCKDRIARGGSWRTLPSMMTSSSSIAFHKDHRRATLGFRVAREVE